MIFRKGRMFAFGFVLGGLLVWRFMRSRAKPTAPASRCEGSPPSAWEPDQDGDG